MSFRAENIQSKWCETSLHSFTKPFTACESTNHDNMLETFKHKAQKRARCSTDWNTEPCFLLLKHSIDNTEYRWSKPFSDSMPWNIISAPESCWEGLVVEAYPGISNRPWTILHFGSLSRFEPNFTICGTFSSLNLCLVVESKQLTISSTSER